MGVKLQLIKVNNPDLVLFVGEALVGNEAVDQLTKFNQVCRWPMWVSCNQVSSPHASDGGRRR